jgi:hypothetical protein
LIPVKINEETSLDQLMQFFNRHLNHKLLPNQNLEIEAKIGFSIFED